MPFKKKKIATYCPAIHQLPKIIFQTHPDKSKIPEKVYNSIEKFAPGYKHIILDDSEAIEFLSEAFTEREVNAFNTIKMGCHKADLLRYCLLYVYGGIYLDIKTELVKPLADIFTHNYFYCVFSINKHSIYQGILASPPKNPLFLQLIEDMVISNETPLFDVFWLYPTFSCYKLVNNYTDTPLIEGYNKNNQYPIDIFILKEYCDRVGDRCHDGLDRYGLCYNIYYKDNIFFKTRYSDYPW